MGTEYNLPLKVVYSSPRGCYIQMYSVYLGLVKQMGTEYNLPLKVVYSSPRGFYIQMYSGGKDGYTTDNLPGIFIKLTKYKNTFSFTTLDLVLYKL